MSTSRLLTHIWWALLLLPLLAACAPTEGTGRAFQAATTCPEATRLSSRGEPIGVVSGKVRYCWPGEANCFCDSWGDCYATSGYVACTPPPATDAAADATADARADADAAVDAGVCPEAIRLNSRGEPVGVSSGKIRYCWPGMAACVCDSWGDCYTSTGYVACTPPPATDAGADAAPDAPAADATPDAAADAGVCPEAVRTSSRGEPIGVSSGKVRYCWPGMASCLCDAWGDCYAQSGYVACAPPPPPAPGAPSPTPAPPTDTVTYTGTLTTALGQRTNTLTVGGIARTVYSYVPTNRSSRPPLVIAYHGTDLWGDQMLANMDALNFAEQNGVVVLAPDARYQDAAHADFNRPAGNARYWETAYNTNVNTNPDLLLTRALIKEARRALNIDLDRVYVVGYSNGGFMALTAAVQLRTRIAGFAESSAGLVNCATRPDCAFRGTALTCAALRTQPGYCNCTGADKPIALPTSGGRPGFLWHAAEDTTVSVYYTCTLDARMTTRGIPHRVELWSGEHYVTDTFMPRAWAYLRAYIR